jgi:phospholipid/cholesterol/gamma-HCH transport system substrate-binding protein
MSRQNSVKDILVGLIVIAAIVGMLGLVGLATDGPGFLAKRTVIDVVFLDGQGIRVGSPVRIAGLDAGNVVDSDVAEDNGRLKALVRISIPERYVKKLKQDVRISIVPGLTGMSHVNILSAGTTAVPLVPGQRITGVETSFFDPIMKQVGLGPEERTHISHTIGEVREMVDSVVPLVRRSLTSLQETTTGLHDMAEGIRPTVEATAAHVEELTRRINNASPKIESTIDKVEVLAATAGGVLTENREDLRQTVGSVKVLTASANDVVAKNRLKVERLLDGAELSRRRVDSVLFQADKNLEHVSQILVQNRAEVDRSISNIKDATDWANKLVQKLFTNPFVLSPLYKPSPEDIRVQTVYDTAQVFSKGAQELNDAAKKLESLQATASTPEQKQQLSELANYVRVKSDNLDRTSFQISESLKRPSGGRGARR